MFGATVVTGRRTLNESSLNESCVVFVSSSMASLLYASIAKNRYGRAPGALGSATRHTGHVFFVRSHSRRHCSWNLCPQGISRSVAPSGASMSVRHTGHPVSLSSPRAPGPSPVRFPREATVTRGRRETASGCAGEKNVRVSSSAMLTSPPKKASAVGRARRGSPHFAFGTGSRARPEARSTPRARRSRSPSRRSRRSRRRRRRRACRPHPPGGARSAARRPRRPRARRPRRARCACPRPGGAPPPPRTSRRTASTSDPSHEKGRTRGGGRPPRSRGTTCPAAPPRVRRRPMPTRRAPPEGPSPRAPTSRRRAEGSALRERSSATLRFPTASIARHWRGLASGSVQNSSRLLLFLGGGGEVRDEPGDFPEFPDQPVGELGVRAER